MLSSAVLSLGMVSLINGLLLLLSYITNNTFPQPLAPNEERECIARMLAGDEGARNILTEHNLRLVAHVIKKYDNTGEDIDDLISIGTIGLIKAINTFNPTRGARLATYAARCIENESSLTAGKLSLTLWRPRPRYSSAPPGKSYAMKREEEKKPMVRRIIVGIDEKQCNGCGRCISPCAEGAIEMRNGKAKVIREELCDGAGFCLEVCPTGTLSIKAREAPAFDEQVAKRHLAMRREGRLRPSSSLFRLGRGDHDNTLFPIRCHGISAWICVECLPVLIHEKAGVEREK